LKFKEGGRILTPCEHRYEEGIEQNASRKKAGTLCAVAAISIDGGQGKTVQEREAAWDQKIENVSKRPSEHTVFKRGVKEKRKKAEFPDIYRQEKRDLKRWEERGEECIKTVQVHPPLPEKRVEENWHT